MKTEMLLQLSACSSLTAYRIHRLLAEANRVCESEAFSFVHVEGKPCTEL